MDEERQRCSWVHDTLCVDPHGDVFACCHLRPAAIGNINENTLADIYNGERIREFRQQEIDGTLACRKGCTLRQQDVAYEDVTRDYHKDIKMLQIEFSEKCNIACIMCTQDHHSRLELDETILVNNVEVPQSNPRILLYGGEPLVIQSAKRFFDHCAEHGAKVSFITNGTAISEAMAKKIALHCHAIVFSLNAATKAMHEIVNAGSKFDKVIRNINRVIAAKRSLKGKVVIGGHMTLVPQNLEELPLFIEQREAFGFEWINFGYDVSVPPLLAADPDRKRRLGTAVHAALARCAPVRVEPSSLRRLFGDALG
jgi:radical SAM protein with 4Fe4S-binding SPASM domain